MIQSYFKDIRQEIIKELKSAKSEINVAVCWFTSNELFDVLCQRLSEIPVNLIVLNDAINNKPDGLDFQKFIDLGGKFYFGDVEKPMHNKYCIIDGSTMINGSYNWTYFAENKNYENITIIKNEVIASEFLLDFKRLTEECKLVSSVKDVANTETQEICIVEDAGLRTKTEFITDVQEPKDSKLSLKCRVGIETKRGRIIWVLPDLSCVPIEKEIFFLPILGSKEKAFRIRIVYTESSKSNLTQEVGNFLLPIADKYFKTPYDITKKRFPLSQKFSVDVKGKLTVSTTFPPLQGSTEVISEKFDIAYLVNGLE